jgi:hypothetical protein
MSERTQPEPTRRGTSPLIRRGLLLLTGLALLLGLARLAYPVYRQHQLIAALRRLGYRVDTTPLFSATTHPWLARLSNDRLLSGALVNSSDAPAATDAELKLIAELFSLMYVLPGQPASCSLELCATEQVTDAGIAHFRGLQQLRKLDLQSEPLTWKSLEHLQNCRGLVYLHLCHNNITDRGLPYLKNLNNLTDLALAGAKLGRANLSCIKGLVKLEELELWGAPLTDADLANFSGLTSLKRLGVGNSQIAGPGLKHLTSLKALEDLNLAETQLDDAGLDNFPWLPSLEHLDLADTKVTTAGLSKIPMPLHCSRLQITRSVNDSPDPFERYFTTRVHPRTLILPAELLRDPLGPPTQ